MELIQKTEISIYKGKLTTQAIINGIAKIKKAFPLLPLSFYEVLDERFVNNNFTDDRLTDAVNHVIDTCVYPTPTIAQFISFDKKYKVFTYDEMLKKTNELGAEIWKSYKTINIGNSKPLYAHINDIELYKIPIV